MRKHLGLIITFVSIVLAIIFIFAVINSNNSINNQSKVSSGPAIAIGYKQIKTDSQIKTVIDSSDLNDGNLIVKFHHNSTQKEPISVTGHVNYQLSQTTASPKEIVTLTVFNWSTEYFEIKIGSQSDKFGFGNQAESLDNDTAVLKEFVKQGINKVDVVLEQDYAPKVKGKEQNPYSKTYQDTKSGKSIMIISSLPMVTADGTPIDVGWDIQGKKFVEKNNLFKATVDGVNVTLTVKNDQPFDPAQGGPDGRKKNDKLTFHAQLFLNGIEQVPTGPVLLAVDPINPNYSNNTLEWDYGIAKRRLRLIEGNVLGNWIFPANPNGNVRIVYNQTGSYKLKLGIYKFNDDEERVSAAQFNAAIYPFEVSDTGGPYYPDANPETASVDGYVSRSVSSEIWSSLTSGAGTGKSDSGTFLANYIAASTTSNQFAILYRNIMLFDTSGLPDTAVVSAATLSIYGASKADSLSAAPDSNIYSSTPASNTALANADYGNLGSTAFSTAITYSSISTSGYNDFALNASGISAISLTGISKFGLRNANYDVANSAPNWVSNAWTQVQFYASEGGAGFKPKLVVTYVIPATNLEKVDLQGVNIN